MISYNDVVFGKDEPEMMIGPSSQGPVMVTREGAWLLDSNGNVIAQIDKDQYMRDWLARFKK